MRSTEVVNMCPFHDWLCMSFDVNDMFFNSCKNIIQIKKNIRQGVGGGEFVNNAPKSGNCISYSKWNPIEFVWLMTGFKSNVRFQVICIKESILYHNIN